MQKKYPETVKAISLNVDHDEDGEPSAELQKEVLDKLTEIDLEVTNVLSSSVYDDVMEKRYIFSLPAALVFGADGKLLAKLDGGFSYTEDVIPLVEKATDHAKTEAADQPLK